VIADLPPLAPLIDVRATPHLVEAESIEAFVRDRLECQFVVNQAPIIDVKMQLLKCWKKVSGITFDAPIAVVATMDSAPAFGMAFEVKGKEIRIRQLQGARGFSTRRRYHPCVLGHGCLWSHAKIWR